MVFSREREQDILGFLFLCLGDTDCLTIDIRDMLYDKRACRTHWGEHTKREYDIQTMKEEAEKASRFTVLTDTPEPNSSLYIGHHPSKHACS